MNDSQRRVLRAFLAAQLDVLPAPANLDPPEEVANDLEAFLAKASPVPQQIVEVLLEAIHLVSLGTFADKSPAERRRWLHEWFSHYSPIPKQTRDLVGLLSGLGWLIIYSRPSGRKSAWKTEKPVDCQTVDVPDKSVEPPPTCAVCIVGSGAGGAVMAARLAQADVKDMLIVEAGPWVSPKDFGGRWDSQGKFALRDDVALQQSFAFAGVQPALSHRIPIPDILRAGRVGFVDVLQARVVGGGPAINNAICLPIPVPSEASDGPWAAWEAAGIPFTYDQLSHAYQSINSDLAPLPSPDCVSGWRSAIFGPKGLGWKPLPVAVSDCVGCGGCNTGCRYGKKTGGLHGQRTSGPQSHLELALAKGVQVASGWRADRFEMDNGRVRRLILTRGSVTRSVEARAFVLAAGPIASTGVLARTGLGRDLPLGQRVSANIVTPVYGVIRDHGTGNRDPGLQMCFYVGKDGELLLETYFHYPGSIAASLPGWFEQHRDRMEDYESLAGVGVTVPTGAHGYVDSGGQLILAPNNTEFRRLKQGLVSAARALFRSGATIVYPATKDPMCFDRSQQKDLDALVEKEIEDPADLSLGTAHPQGGNAMSTKAGISVVDENFQVRGVQGLFVTDSSLFPAGCGVNPMLTTMALAHMAAPEVRRFLEDH